MLHSDHDERTTAVGRRSLLKLGAAGAALSMFGPSLLTRGAAAAMPANGEVMNASHWGAFKATIKDGRFVAIKPWEKDPHPTHMLDGVLDITYSPTRIKYPMVRRAWLEKGPGAMVEDRGKGDFVRVSWDKALDLVANEIKRVQGKYGPTSIFAGSYGWRSSGCLGHPGTLLRRLMNTTGGYVKSSGDYSTGAAQVIMPHVMGSLEVYEQQTSWPVVAENTELLVFWGADPVKTCQISNTVAEHGAYPGMQAYKAKGKKVICIDPVRTETAKFFGAELVSPRPQTDVAMMLGIAHTLYTEKLHNKAFLDSCTTGFDRFVPYLTGKSDGTPKDAAWAEKICGVPAETIKDLARCFAKSRTMLAGGWSLQRQHHGEQAHWMLVTLAAMLGQIGLPGGGFGFSYHYASGGNPTTRAPRVTVISDGTVAQGAPWLTSGGVASIPCARVVDMLLNPGKEYQFNGKTERYPDIKMAYWCGGNPFAHHQDRNRQVKAWRKLETFIVHDVVWTATARMADIVLPAATSIERNDVSMVGDYSATAIVAMKKGIEPIFEARSDYDIFAGVAKRLGKEREFTEGRAEIDWVRAIYEKAYNQGKSNGVPMPDFDAFWTAGIVEFEVPPANAKFVRHAKFREDPLLNPLGTPSGLIEIFSRNIEKMGYDDCPPHPAWMEPLERLAGPDTKYPLHVAASHPNDRLHSQLCGTKLNLGYRIAGREPCLMNPADAAARGIKDGDLVRLFNGRGQILVGVRISGDVMPGVVQVYEGGWYDPAEPGVVGTLCKYGDVNVLTPDIPSSKLAMATCGQTVMAEAEKFKGTVPEVTVFSAPAAAA
ncbi:trimethylamine N-oxide reductase 1 [Rhodovastum atsumiense]|uniref:Dimethyl sulfoxide/trimethylamine N-oxide reductase n=1 Tax=Rhodovastum atsumiense TaxID=504468 RepID=A0A5M6IYV1_9PROT|nr:trimethylamine-N-oxide reductase TorA [Rhodovastum atsumiense]KAA5613530.1 trimethylamine-N-oxide reductase TorA [Rhodovastum atsumiense]CAH2603280.1 trimethylamine N-oxide reductase 1 [Rhodovastum atsumiense]